MKYKNFGIVYNPIVKNSEDVANALVKILEEKKLKYAKFSIDSMKPDADFVFVIGGDGTFAGCPCLTHEEAFVLSAQHEDSHIFYMDSKFVDQVWEEK